MSSEELRVLEGSICSYKIFDVGNNIDLEYAVRLLQEQKTSSAFVSFGRFNRSLLVAEHPTFLELEPWRENIGGETLVVEAHLKIWSFGTFSLRLKLGLSRTYTLRELSEISHFLENSENFHRKTIECIQPVLALIQPAVEKCEIWDQFEDYLFFHFNKIEGVKGTLSEAVKNSGISSLVLGEKFIEFSQQINKSVTDLIFQYEKNDLLLLHWNGAVLLDLEDDEDMAQSIEFALCQLLELRYYDNLLDQQLKTLYLKIENESGSVLRSPYHELSKKAALEYIDISEIVDRVGNSFKVIGDFYYATIYKAAVERFQIPVWRNSVDRKLGNLAEVSKLFQGEINEKRNQILEGIIIILIAIEVVPFVFNLLIH